MKVRYNKTLVRHLEKELITAQRLNNLRLYDIIAEGPEEYGFDCGVWNSAIIAEFVFREYNVAYNPKYFYAHC